MNEQLNLASLQQENTILSQKNSQLLQDLQTLQKQFRSAVEVSNSFDSLSQKNSELQNQVHTIGNEKEDLQRRLNIALCRIEKLNDTISTEKQNCNLNSLNEINLLKNKLEDEKRKNSSQLSKIQIKIQNLEEEIKFKNKTIEQNNIEFESIFKAATQHFNQIIDNNDDLVRLLLIPPQLPEIEPQIITEPVIVKKKKKKAKPRASNQKIQQEIYDRAKVEAEIRDQCEAFYTQQLNEISALNKELQNKNDRLIKESENFKSNSLRLTEENSKLRIQIQCEKNEQESKIINQSIQFNDKIRDLTSQLNSSEQSNDLFKKQISPLLSKVHYLEQQNKILMKQLNKVKSSNSSLQEDNDKLVQENDVLSQKNNEMQTKLSQFSKSSNDLQSLTKKLQSSVNEKNAENQKLKLTITALQRSSQLQNDEIESQKDQLNKTSQMLQEETERSSKLQISIKQIEKKCQILEETAKTSQEKLYKSKEPCECDTILPLSVWSVPEMPEELIDIVEQVANNQTLKFPAKIRQVLSIICKFYISKCERCEKELNQKQDDEITEQSKILDFSNHLKLTFPEINSNFEDFLDNKEIQQKMKDTNNEIRKNSKSLKIEKDILEKKILDILLYLQVDSVEEAMKVIKEMSDNISNLEILNNDHVKNISILTKRFENLKIDFTKRISDLNKEIEKQKNLFNNMANDNELLNEKLIEANHIIEQNQESYEHKTRENQVIFNAKVNEYEKQNSLLHDQINSQNSTNAKLNENIENLKKELQKATNTILILKKKQNSLIEQIKQIASYKEENDKIYNQKILNERNIFDQKLGQESEKFKLQINDLTELNEKLKNQIENYENLNENLKSQISDLSIRLQKAELKFETVMKEAERDKIVIDSQHKSEILALKNDFSEKIAEKESLVNKAKREVMSLVALHFCSLFDANSEMNEANFAIFVKAIKNRLADLVSCENKLRVLLQIGPQQSIVDCVAQLLLSNTQMLGK
ncbi:hypothetical protein M9Y10_002501 [Tritrichomonas musculus]|uniref:GRIP domain-containing protein n=1 Tax=Tritrichomonas musculus TaxID=1915356 RepID=A0ABR2L9Z0_9EUKA